MKNSLMQSPEHSNVKLIWAFAIDPHKPKRNVRRHLPAPKRYLDRYRIISLSPRLKAYGVRAGMLYSEAKQLAPEMRILVCNR